MGRFTFFDKRREAPGYFLDNFLDKFSREAADVFLGRVRGFWAEIVRIWDETVFFGRNMKSDPKRSHVRRIFSLYPRSVILLHCRITPKFGRDRLCELLSAQSHSICQIFDNSWSFWSTWLQYCQLTFWKSCVLGKRSYCFTHFSSEKSIQKRKVFLFSESSVKTQLSNGTCASF